MRHSYEPNLGRLQTANDALDYLVQGFVEPTEKHRERLQKALALSACNYNANEIPSRLKSAALLKELGTDRQTIIAALLGDSAVSERIGLEELTAHFGEGQVRLIKNVRWLNDFSVADPVRNSSDEEATREAQAERVRQLVLVMVEDVRALLVKLAYRVCLMQELLRNETTDAKRTAQETLDVYAPLANRLGVAQLKWQLEDLAFRIIEPDTYKRVAKSLEERREDREKYIGDFVESLQTKLTDSGQQNFDVLGRPKHLYSIWRKIQRKRVEVSDLFDVRAVRVLVDSVQDCYAVLGVVHGSWQHLPGEFDDYIANTKENGYQSLHTAVVGPQGKAVEIQIRTRTMNDDAELGVAAHWRYKEGGKEGGRADTRLQRSINSLRSLLDQKELDDESLLGEFTADVFADRVYVFTPKGEVVDLPAHSTPLDFAYHVHTEIGHRCRGAKINGRIVQLGHKLDNGDQVEVLTAKEANPSRDWMNKSLGFLQTSRARSKVRAWFNVRDQEVHFEEGKTVLERELRRLNARDLDLGSLIKKLNFDKEENLYQSIGRGDVSAARIAAAISNLKTPELQLRRAPKTHTPRKQRSGGIEVAGVGSLLTQMAACCNPVPYDPIVGFITRGKGVTVHRRDCNNILNLRANEQNRLVQVDWGGEDAGEYQAAIDLVAYDRQGLLRDVTAAITNSGLTVAALSTETDNSDLTAHMNITVEVNSIEQLVALMDKLRQLRNVISVERARELAGGSQSV